MKVTDKKFAASPTKQTLKYITSLVDYKRTHIEREEARLLELETMRNELLALIDGKRGAR